MVVTTGLKSSFCFFLHSVVSGSQAEPMSALNLISQNAATKLRLDPDDYIIYSAKVGFEKMR